MDFKSGIYNWKQNRDQSITKALSLACRLLQSPCNMSLTGSGMFTCAYVFTCTFNMFIQILEGML